MLNVKYLSALIGLMAAIAFLAAFSSNSDQKTVKESSRVYQNLEDGQRLPIENPDKSFRQYVANGEPLSKDRCDVLAKKQEAPQPKME